MKIGIIIMNISKQFKQTPNPGERLLRFRGDCLKFTLTLPDNGPGSGWLRSNIGYASIARHETIQEVETDTPYLGRDWFDVPMKQIDQRRFEITIPLCEVGHFEAKCYFLKQDSHDPIWPEGSNTTINVEAADTCCANIIYNAFVRQFGPNKSGNPASDPKETDCIHLLDKKDYTVIPKSGTFRDLIKELDFIIGDLGCRIIQTLPIHPTPTTYARMGRFGSPYATLSFTTVDPAQAEFDPKATPLEQFIELVDAVHERHAKLMIDIAINHTGWAADLHESHPEWLVRGTDGKIQVPGAWGVMWEDLTKLDYRHKELWQYMADVFLTWCHRGVDGFRCDAGYMIPTPAWTYITAKVREQYPDTIFFLEGLGGKISVTRDILNIGNFNWAYSELFQNYDRSQIEHYLPEAWEISKTDGVLIHFSETHDNNRLAARSQTWASLRTGLCALASLNGGFAFANGVEWFATEKINVHDARSLNWGAKPNLVPYIRRLNTLLKHHPAFHTNVDIRFIHKGGGNYIGFLRTHLESNKKLLIVVNLDDQTPVTAYWRQEEIEIEGNLYWDLISGEAVQVSAADGARSVYLPAGCVYCLTPDASDLTLIETECRNNCIVPVPRVESQRLRAKTLDVIRQYLPAGDITAVDMDEAANRLQTDPAAFCQSLNPFTRESRVITWRWQADARREVMLPPEHFLLIRCAHPFRARISVDHKTIVCENSLQTVDGENFTLVSPLTPPSAPKPVVLKLSVFIHGRTDHADAPLLLLPKPTDIRVQSSFARHDLLRTPLLFLGTNGRGGMCRAHALWGKLDSRYDALLAANLSPDFPEDRRILFTRCRGWVLFQGYSPEIRSDCLHSFSYDDRRGFWNFMIPTGQGQYIWLTAQIQMIEGENAVSLIFHRHSSIEKQGMLDDAKPIRLILRPDIEDRNFHETTKAFMGPEHTWQHQITSFPDGFMFSPDQNRKLECRISSGSFTSEPEWQYMIYRAQDADRGMDPHSDLYSPGYFSAALKGGESVELTAAVNIAAALFQTGFTKISPSIDSHPTISDRVRKSLEHYIVKRESLHTVIAGYPWFLDWGRDTLIFVRGLIAVYLSQTRKSPQSVISPLSILKQFAKFEQDGTLPNMIRGSDAGNRNTSDAPLWFFAACSDLYKGDSEFLNEDCGGRTLKKILISMARSMMRGTPNGVRMDAASGLLFSPSHYTWMDTNFPAGTPREGYPIEIQALWAAALTFLSNIDSEHASEWQELMQKVKDSIIRLFYLPDKGYLSDCLYASSSQDSADQAEPDDALRPNQLFAITLDALSDMDKGKSILSACEELIVPGAIRSLADRPVKRALPIYRDGHLLNNPNYPYQGVYAGDEDTRRKPAYHNGTAWTWVFPSFCEAWVKVYGPEAKQTALAWLESSIRWINEGCAGHIPEILDGNYPHTRRGCDAQAWGASEWIRVWEWIHHQ